MMESRWFGDRHDVVRAIYAYERLLWPGMTAKEAQAVMEEFREGSLNILVATSVLSEGVDIPECNGVIRYMYIKDVISEVQVPGV